MKSRRSIPAGMFKAQCLQLLDQVAEQKDVIIVTKRGKPVAKVVPIDDVKPRSLIGSVTFLGDIVSPISEAWDAEK